MGRAWRTSEVHTKYWSEIIKERSYMGDLTLDEGIILKWTLGRHCVDWIQEDQDRVQG
jgi:hypothetical protein